MLSLKRHASPSNASCRPPQHHQPPCLLFSLSFPISISICFLGFCVLYLCLSPCCCLSVPLYLLLEGDTPYTHTPLTLSEQLMLETRERAKERGRRKTNKGNGKMHSSKPKEIERRRNLIICLFLSSAHSPCLHPRSSLCDG